MTIRKKKTFEEHLEYVEELSRISFFLAFELRKFFPARPLDDILREHTPFSFHALELEPRTVYPGFTVAEAGTAREFEEKMWGSVKKTAYARAARYYRSSVGMAVPEDYNAGSLKYDGPLRGLPSSHCNFHIANAVAPDSIFTDPDYLPRCFMELMEKSEKEFGYDTIRTSTWLNDEPRFLALFPEEWRKNRRLVCPMPDQPCIPGWSFGEWGQIVTARGTFNRNVGEFVRKNLCLPHRSYYSECKFHALREHLKGKYNVQKYA